MRTGLAALAAVALWPATAQAGLEICNDTDETQSVAIGHRVDGTWTSEGWWNVAPGGCAEPVKGALTNRFYYYRTEVTGGRFEDEGIFFCTQSGAFTIPGQGDCAARGFDEEGFRRIDTGETATEFTLTLVTPEGGAAAGKDAARAAPAPQAWDSGLVQGQAGEPFTEQARFQGCDILDGAEYCAFHASGWKWYAWYGGPTPDAFLERLQTLPVGQGVELVGDILHYGDISVEIALSRVTLRPDAPHQAQFEALQGSWVSADDPNYRIEVVGSEMFETYGGGMEERFFWRFADSCDMAPPEAGPVLLKTTPETQETQCYLPDAVTGQSWEMFYAGRGNLLRFRRP